MGIKLSSLRADLGREAAGDWVGYPDFPGAAFKVSSVHTPSFQTARDLLMQKLARQFKGKTVPSDVLTRELGAVYAEHILHDWRGFDEAYTRERALEVLTDPAFRDVFTAVQWCSAEIGRLEVVFEEEAEKNSAAPSAGTLPRKASKTG